MIKKPQGWSKTFLSLVTLIGLLVGGLESALAQTAPPTGGVEAARQGDVLGAKAFLEDLIIRRLSQELATRVDQDHFNLGAQLDIVKKPKEERPRLDPLSDLDLGFLDPEALFKSYSAQGSPAEKFLENYLIRKVDVYVGLRESLGEEAQQEVREWITARVQSEFGNVGSGVVSLIRQPVKPEQPPKPDPGFVEQLKDFQELAGQGVLALAILLGLILWALLSKGGAQAPDLKPAVNITNQMESGSDMEGQAALGAVALEQAETEAAREKVKQLGEKILELTSKVPNEVENLIREWCQAGEEGIANVANFAEVSGKMLGRLPIPVEFKKEVTQALKKMSGFDLKDRVQSLERVYWDLVATVNLGSDSLRQPFSFLGAASSDSVNQVLMENNLKLQTIASVYMPDRARKSYLASLDSQRKIELLNEAAGLAQVAEEELSVMESQLASHFNQGGDGRSVSLADTLSKLIGSMGQMESIQILQQVKGPMLDKFKRTQPHLAFLSQWANEPLRFFLSKASNDEIMAYLRLSPDLTQHFLGLVPPMVERILRDDLQVTDSMRDTDKEELLQTLSTRLNQLVAAGEIDLESVFVENPEARGGGRIWLSGGVKVYVGFLQGCSRWALAC
jgi:hypothetical protein